ncbi:GD13767 [Drosophila simulans]|uniref:GD13767 n=1 Tax=Drosophila simulans TaxID=7240 RepID=B4QPJ3_DROSI|nr:GD13767 [Drosophila simulans]
MSSEASGSITIKEEASTSGTATNIPVESSEVEAKKPEIGADKAESQSETTECGKAAETSENHLKRLQNLRKELSYLSETDWMYESLDRKAAHKFFTNPDRNREDIVESLNRENSFLDRKLMEEKMDQQLKANPNEMDGVLSDKIAELTHGLSEMDVNKESFCTARKGVITSLESDRGVIDKGVFFDCKVAEDIILDLQVGCVVEYLTFTTGEAMRVVKVKRIIEHCWEDTSQQEIEKAVDNLKNEKPKFFNTETRRVLGLISQRLASSIDVETDYGQLTVELDNIEMNFIPTNGDRVRLECNIQLDDGFVDKQGEILEVTKLFPTRIQEGEKCIVQRVYMDIVVLGPETYVLKTDLPTGTELHLDDIVLADLIECQYSLIPSKTCCFHILRGEAENIPYVLFGPPGSGKTVTLVETLLQLVRNLPGARILVGTPSNSSADLVTKRLIDSKALLQGDFIRLVSFNQVERDLIPPELMSYCATSDVGAVGSCEDKMVVTESGLKLCCQAKFMGTHRITISTCTTLGNFLQLGFPAGHFTHVLFDEAGQCTEPETMVPIVMLTKKRCQVVLSGDPRQLQSVVHTQIGKKMGFSISFLERLLERSPYRKDLQRFPDSSGYNPLVLTKLLYNYRALPSVMSIYNRLFYDDELIPVVSETDSRESRLLSKLRCVFETEKDIPQAHGTFFYGIIGENRQNNDSPSWFNPQEVREVFLMTIALYRANVTADQIGIITPYQKQVKMLRSMFIGTDVVMPKIGSVEEFQGQERDIMLISTVRSSEEILRLDAHFSLGFVRCSKRFNVAVSRARAMMIIFGNPHLLAVDECWRQLILFCAKNNAYFGCDLPQMLVNQEDEGPVCLETFVP